MENNSIGVDIAFASATSIDGVRSFTSCILYVTESTFHCMNSKKNVELIRTVNK